MFWIKEWGKISVGQDESAQEKEVEENVYLGEAQIWWPQK